MTPSRRELVAGIGLVGVAGCIGSDGDGGGSKQEPIEVGSAGGGVSLVRHHFEAPEIGPTLFVTIRNTRDAGFELGDLTCYVYDGEEMVAEAYRTISMSGQSTEEFDTLFVNTETDREQLRSATNYEIIIDVPYTNGVTDEVQKEFEKPIEFADASADE
ncbi:hypothetical protein GCM10028857_19240 [Salinarchaeum chitinilyticum]